MATTVTNTTPPWLSYQQTGNPANIVDSPTVAAAIGGKVDATGGQMAASTSAYGLAGGAITPIGRLISDWFAMRAYGCPLIGTSGHDDLPGLQALVADCIANNLNGIPRLDIVIPPGTDLYLSAPLVTTGCWVTIRGAGMYSSRIIMAPGAAGAIIHGTTSSPAKGPIQVQDVGFWDGNQSGSGVPAISACFDPAHTSALSNSVFNNVFFRFFSQAFHGTDVARDGLFTNCISYAPDYAISPLAAFSCVGSSSNTFGCYTFVGNGCRQVNHVLLFDFYSQTQMEGVRLTDCTSYGGGLIRAYMSPTPASLSGVTTYQAPIYYITNCDWQGQGPGIDLYRCSDVRIVGGFYIADALQSSPPANVFTDPAGTSRTFRRHMSFQSCDGVQMSGVRLDTLSTYEAGAALVWVSNDTTYFKARDTLVQSATSKSIYGFYYQSGGNNNRCRALDTDWIVWNGGNKIYDPGGAQIEQEAVFDPVNYIFYGNVDTTGRYTIDILYSNLTADSNNRYSVTYPSMRQAGGQLFNGTPPFPTISVQNASPQSAAASVTVVSFTATGCVWELQGASSGYQANFKVHLSGY